MSYKLGQKAQSFQPYQPIEGEYRIRLDANESFLPPYDGLKEAIFQAMDRVALNRYPDPYAREVCRHFAAYYGVDERFVTAGNGSDELISILCNTFLQKGEKALVLAPDFSMYQFYLELAECRPVVLKKGRDFAITADEIIEVLNREECRMFLFSNPCNPTSLGMPAEEVNKIIANTNALVVVDEAYMDFWDQSILQDAAGYDNVIVLRTCSKMLGMAAVRLGFAVANERLTSVLRAAKSPYNVNSLTQAAGAAVFQNPDLIRGALRRILASRNELYLFFQNLMQTKDITVYPTCTNFVAVRVKHAAEVFEQLKQQSIIVRNFGDFLRITAGSEAENKELFEQLLHIL